MSRYKVVLQLDCNWKCVELVTGSQDQKLDSSPRSNKKVKEVYDSLGQQNQVEAFRFRNIFSPMGELNFSSSHFLYSVT